MLGMCGISFPVIFIQFYIIAGLSRKINTLFEKILQPFPHRFIEVLRAAAPASGTPACSGICQGGNFCTIDMGVVIFTARKKIGFLSLSVERNYVNRFLHTFHQHPCGKALWTTLWIMWKTMSFQQVFRFFENPHPHVENCAYRCA